MKKVFFLLIIIFSPLCAQEIRKPSVSGQFYPADPQELNQQIDRFFSNSGKEEISGELTAILVPHAGYIFSGQVAAYGFKLLAGKKFDTIILIGLAHRYPLGNKAAVYAKGYFETPLGKVKVDETLVEKLCQTNSLFEKNYAAHQEEHSLEVELPFLQNIYASGQFQIIPILVGNPDLKICREIGETIAQVANEQRLPAGKAGKTKNILLICSSDMSHYPEYTRANRIDKMALQVLQRFEPTELKETIDALLLQGIPNLNCLFCAEGALFTTMYAVKKLGANEVRILHYANSGDVAAGTKNQVVGYAAVSFIKSAQLSPDASSGEGTKVREEKSMKTEFRLSPEAQKELLTLARKSIESSLENYKLQIADYRLQNPELKNLGAVFVTLRKKGQLRGCIGTTMARRAIYEEVGEMACAAAFEDYRFPPVEKKELEEIKIEISVLSPLEKVKSAEEIKPKIHGVYLRQGNNSGLFLPQVWEETGWNKEEFLSYLTSHKAGLPQDAWKDPATQLYTFTVFSFEEK